MSIPQWMRKEVILRARRRCEYCQLSQAGQEATFHIDHVNPISEGGGTLLENLALACVSCSLRKGARRMALDHHSKLLVPLFDPRTQNWSDHFLWTGHRISGTTPGGRATVHLLKMNRQLMMAIRIEESALGRHPPPTGT